MSVFISTTFAQSNSSVLEAVRKLVENNIRNIELGSIHRYEEGLDKKLLEIGGNYITHNFFPPVDERIILNIASVDNAIRKKSITFIKGAIGFAEKIGAEIYTIHPGFLEDPLGESKSSEKYDFKFPSEDLSSPHPNYQACNENLFRSLCEIGAYLDGKNVKITIETQGSFTKKNTVLFSKPDEFIYFMNSIQNPQIGINLNLGHLNLASRVWGFDKTQVLEIVKPRLLAVEVSHNDGVEDDHQALRLNSWYLNILRNYSFKDIPVVFEGRNLEINQVVDSYLLLANILE